MPRWLKLSLLSYGLFTAAALGLAVLAELPTRQSSLEPSPSPFVMRDGRKSRSGCGLNQRAITNGCESIHTTTAEEEVSFESRLKQKYLSKLQGTLTLPVGIPGRRPAVVLIHGSGPQTRDEVASGEITRPVLDAPFPVFKQLAQFLGEQGFVVLRYDKRSCVSCYKAAFKQRHADFTQFRFSDFTDDARDALDYLASRPEVDAQRLVVIGHSQGGMLAPHVAQGDSRVAAVVSLAGPTRNLMDGLVEQLHGMAAIRRHQFDLYGAWTLDLQASRYRDCFSRLSGPHDPGDQCMGGGVTLQALAEEKILADTTVETWTQLSCPGLVLQGTLDRNVHPRVANELAQRLASRDAEVHLIRGTGHLLNDHDAPTNRPVFDSQVLEAMRAFFSSVKLGP
ncbi:MAG: alpha/beta fold hydrolase [Polyangiaceae bacterium]|nr:alpha/beta fold hydrolase [Myxococcales bacterium]MCB9584665.1 alpha/beta fold hydrolase [Polyangiaceae bacterium]MCB9609102.1 alpha/beta fold hydrolase [Polyangiaceae bacterium]